MPFGIGFGGKDPMKQVQQFGQNVQGLLQSPKKQAGLAGNPMFNAGMGLLGSSYDAGINPFQAAMQGLQKGTAEQQSQADRERLDKLRKALAAMIAKQGGQVPGQPAPTAIEQGLQQSRAPGQPGASMGGAGAAPQNPNPRRFAFADQPGGAAMEQARNRMAWEQIIGR